MQKRHASAPGVACILAAGNQTSVAMRDLLQQLVVNKKACIVKLNPVNDWIGADLQNMLQPLIEADMLRLVYGGTSTAQVRNTHPLHSIALIVLELDARCYILRCYILDVSNSPTPHPTHCAPPTLAQRLAVGLDE